MNAYTLTLSDLEFLGFLAALIVGCCVTSPVMNILVRLKSRQTISAYVPEHQAKQGTPTMGGLITVIAGVAAWCFAAVKSSPFSLEYLLLFLAFAVVGFVDDYVVPKVFKNKRGLGWKQKILFELVLVAIPLLVFNRASVPMTLLGIIVILFFANAYNFTDGLDGLAGSVGIGLLGGLGILAAFLGSAAKPECLACCILIGGLLPFLYLNAPPAKVFMGDVGSLPIGAVVGLIVWRMLSQFGPTGALVVSFVLISLVMFAELVPVPLQIASVKLRGKRIFRKTPIHHGFQDMGIPETTIVWRYAIIQFVCSAAAVTAFVWLRVS